VTNEPIDAGYHERVAGLDRNESAEPAAEDKHRPEAQHAASSEDSYAQPADGIGVNRPEADPICVGWQEAVQEPYHGESGNDPAVNAILAARRD
jgi:hypothetical protein